MKIQIREIKPEEVSCLDDFLYEAIFVPEGEAFPPRSILKQPDLQVYTKDFGTQEGDFAVIALVDERIAGAAWARIMMDYGHIADGVPSIAISLYPEYRGKGIGTRLLTALLEKIKAHGYERVSLSVQKANYAKKMYERAGFTVFQDKEEELLMEKRL